MARHHLNVWAFAALATAAGIGLSACGSIPKPVPEPLSVTIAAFAAAGCSVNFSDTLGGQTGLGAGVHADHTFAGGCDPSRAVRAEPVTPESVVAAMKAAGLVVPASDATTH
jgi:hypothetical protein